MAARRCGRGKGRVQTVIFAKRMGVAKARTWLRENGLNATGKVDVEKNSLRFRQMSPGKCRRGNYWTLTTGHAKQVFCCPKS